MVDGAVRWLAQQVAPKEESCPDPSRVQELDQSMPRDGRRLAKGQGKPEPARLGAGRRLGQYELLLERLQASPQPCEVGAALLDEPGQLLELGHADGRLHVGRLQVVADVAVDVLVIVAVWQLAELPAEPLL